MTTDSEYVDGFPISIYKARFSPAFELPEEWGARIRTDDIGTALVSFCVTGMSGKPNKDGDYVRTNTFQVISVDEVDANMAALLAQAVTSTPIAQVP